MSAFTKTLSLAAVALCAVPLVVLSTAHAETASVRVSDIDFSKPAQVATFEGRVEQAADKFCSGYTASTNLSGQAACKAGVRAEAAEKAAQLAGH